MKRLSTFLIILFFGLQSFSQEYNPVVSNVINSVDLDSLTMWLRNISGEDPVMINGVEETIDHRVDSWGNDLAMEYIADVLESYGLEPTIDNYNANGKNVYATQLGTTYPDQYYMICAHYDAVDYYCADDNGSGTAAVFEAVRILTQMSFEYSIIYALWDQEEIGLVGSGNYAQNASNMGMDILGVINMDMIAYDSDNDMVAEIHRNSASNTVELSNYLVAIDEIYEIPVVPEVQYPGATASDHSRFWNFGYAAVLMIEEYFGGNFNPYYHTENDRIDICNLDYFHGMSQLAIGTLSSLASPVSFGTGVNEQFAGSPLILGNYPNPFSGQTTVTYELTNSSDLNLQLVNSQGSTVQTLVNGLQNAGKHHYEINVNELPKGIYFLVGTTQRGSQTHKLVVQ